MYKTTEVRMLAKKRSDYKDWCDRFIQTQQDCESVESQLSACDSALYATLVYIDSFEAVINNFCNDICRKL